jgi:hypothetical protein
MHEYLEGRGMLHTIELWLLDAVGWGDLDSDGLEEAVVLLSSERRGWPEEGLNGSGLQIQVFAVRSGTVALLTKRGVPSGHVERVLVSRGQIALERRGAHPLRLHFADGRLSLVDPPVDSD